MSGEKNRGGRSLGGGSNEPRLSSWAGFATALRVGWIGLIGDWFGPSSGSGSGFGSSTPPSRGSRGGPASSNSSDIKNDPDRKESWFAGGEKSGLPIQNPEAVSNVPEGNLVKELLRRAAENGPPPDEATSRSGGGHTLDSDNVPSSFIPEPNAPTGEELPVAIRMITFWRNGFTIGDGELLRYDDPYSEQLLVRLNSGDAPVSVFNVSPGQRVELRVSKRINEEYVVASTNL